MNTTRADIRKCKSLDGVKCILEKEFKDVGDITDGRMRVTVEGHQYLDVVEIPASDVFGGYSDMILNNTACLLLCKDDYSEMMFVLKGVNMVGNNVYHKYMIDIRQPRESDVARLKSIRDGKAASFLELFNTKDVVKDFYRKYKAILDKLQKNVTGIKSARDRQRYSQVLISRIMFLFFIQDRGFLSGDVNYLRTKFEETRRNGGNFYRDFLCVLFFDILNTEEADRHTDLGTIPFLNGGLFKEHSIEAQNKQIGVENHILGDILEFLGAWLWHVDDTADEASTTASVNPEILGHIFETMIEDQHGNGAY